MCVMGEHEGIGNEKKILLGKQLFGNTVKCGKRKSEKDSMSLKQNHRSFHCRYCYISCVCARVVLYHVCV